MTWRDACDVLWDILKTPQQMPKTAEVPAAATAAAQGSDGSVCVVEGGAGCGGEGRVVGCSED